MRYHSIYVPQPWSGFRRARFRWQQIYPNLTIEEMLLLEIGMNLKHIFLRLVFFRTLKREESTENIRTPDYDRVNFSKFG